MSGKELRRGEVLSRVKRGELKLNEAAQLLEVSYRQAKRLLRRYRAGGAKALVHGNVGRPSNRIDTERREQALRLVREHYSGEPHERLGPTLASEHLAADHGIVVPRNLAALDAGRGPVEQPPQAQGASHAAATSRPLRRTDSGRRLASRLARGPRAERLSDELR